MNATINVLCYKQKTLKNGEHPLMIRVCKDGKKCTKAQAYQSTPNFGTLKRTSLKGIALIGELIQKLVNEKVSEYSDHILDLKASNKEFTISNVIKKQGGSLAKTTIGEYLESHNRNNTFSAKPKIIVRNW